MYTCRVSSIDDLDYSCCLCCFRHFHSRATGSQCILRPTACKTCRDRIDSMLAVTVVALMMPSCAAAAAAAIVDEELDIHETDKGVRASRDWK